MCTETPLRREVDEYRRLAKLHIKEITAKKRDAELDEELSAVRA